MVLNINSVKRLCTLAGVSRISHENVELLNNLLSQHLRRLLLRLIELTNFCKLKTIGIAEIRFLTQICPNQPTILCSSELSQLCIPKKPFEILVRKIAFGFDPEIRFGKNVITLLQGMTEYYLIDILSKAKLVSSKETLTTNDISRVFKIIADTR